MIINSKEFIKIITLAKGLKCSIINIVGNTIFGTDDNFVHLKHAYFKNPNNVHVYYDTNSMNSFIKEIEEECDLIIDNDGTLHYNDKIYKKLINPNGKYRLMDLANRVWSYEYDDIYNLPRESSCKIEDLRSNEDFLKILENKTSDGVNLLNIENKYLISLFTNLIPINKNDKISLDIYNLDINKFLTKFTIMKKGITVNVFIMYLHL